MANGDFALPIGHLTQQVSDLQLCLGREYLQPVDIPQFSTTHIEGLEVYVENNTPLYAMLNGTITYNPDKNQLILKPTPKALQIMNEISGLLEPPPSKIIYNLPDGTYVAIAVELLLIAQYSALSSQHPVLDIIYQPTGQTMKEYLTTKDQDGQLQNAVEDLANFFIQGVTSFKIPVLAGDTIGRAAEIPQGLSLPAGCSLSSGNDNEYLLLEILDYAGFHMDPAYYLWRFLKDFESSSPNMNFITYAPKNNDNTFDHPLLQALNIDLDQERKPRATVNYQLPGQVVNHEVLLFPLEKLSNWQGAKLGTSMDSREISLIKWRLTNDTHLNLEIKRRPGENSHDYELCGENFSGAENICPNPSSSDEGLMQQVWNDWGQDINDICRILQFPEELVSAIMAEETGHLGQVHPRALRLEPINENQKNDLVSGGIAPNVADNYYDWTNPYGVTIWDIGDPDNWILANIITQSNSITYMDLLNIADRIPYKISPGLMQTLVDKVDIFITNWLNKWYSNVQNTFNLSNPVPQSYSEQLKWLLTGRNSILTGVTYMKYKYAYINSSLIPFSVGATFNAGNLRYDKEISGVLNPYGYKYYGIAYPINMGRYYNGIQNKLIGGLNGYNKFFKSK